MAVGVLGVILLAALQLHNGQATNFVRLPTCPPPSSDPGEEIFYPNAENCSNYYKCDNGNLVNLECPPGLYFCSKKGVCAWAWDCSFDDCKIVNRHRLNFERDNPTCPPPSSDPGKDIFYPNAANCSNYYHCDNGNLVNLECPPGLYFCSKQGVCAWAWDCSFDDCKILNRHRLNSERDNPTCPPPSSDPGKDIFYPNAANCSNYYHCDNGNLVNLECPAGLYFCSKQGVCAWPWDCSFDDCKILNRHRLNFQRQDPTCPPPSSEPGDDILYPNAANCSNYFHCDNGNLVNVDCPPGLYFCTKQGVCAWPWDCTFDDCKIPSVRSHVKDEPVCPVEDPEEHPNVTHIANPANCSTYYKCSNGQPILLDCPAGLFYCEAKEVCTWAWDCDFSNCKMDVKTSYKLGYPKIRNDIVLLLRKLVQRMKPSTLN